MRWKTRVLTALAGFLLAALSSAQNTPPIWDSATTYSPGTLVAGSNGNYYRCISTATNHNPITDTHTFWELYYVRSNVALSIGARATFATFKAAWAFIAPATFASGVVAKLSITTHFGNHSENFTTAFNLDHAFGGQIFISGDNSTNIVFNWPTATNGLVLDQGHRLAQLTGITLHSQPDTDFSAGLLINQSSAINDLNLVIDNFGQGIEAEKGSSFDADALSINQPHFLGINVTDHSRATCGVAHLDGTGGATFGIEANDNSTVDCSSATVSNFAFGVLADNQSVLRADGTVVSSCTEGINAQKWSFVDAGGSSATNCHVGYHAGNGGHMLASGTATTGDTTPYNPTLNNPQGDQSIIIG